MSQRNSDKNKDVIKELEKTISPVLVLNNSSLKPYVELFEYSPENIYQQPLGSLVGFFEVKEFSDESAYIVNHLTAVLKKEYYINPKRPVTESLDSALHKVNMALSGIAGIGNVQWLGKINAAICVLEKNNAHFSVSGNAKIFLHRNKVLSEISEDLASDELEPHPLKTFINVSSGRLEKNDRLLITSADIFHILPTNEIDKNFQRFEGEKFVQFLKTALSNQMEMLASIVVEMTEPAPVVVKKNLTQKKSAKNAFSETTFANSLSIAETLAGQEQINEVAPIESDSNYTDKKTGHIYIQGEAADDEENANSKFSLYQDLAKEKITQAVFVTKNEIRKRFSLYKKQLAKKRALRLEEKARLALLAAEEDKRLAEQKVLDDIEAEQRRAEQEILDKIEADKKLAEQKELEKIQAEQEKILQQELAIKESKLEKERILEQEKQEQSEKERIQNYTPEIPEVVAEIIEPSTAKEKSLSHFELSFKEKLQRAKLEQQGNAVINLKEIHKPVLAHEEIIEEYLEDDEVPVIELDKKDSKLNQLKTLAIQVSEKALPIAQAVSKSTIIISKKLWFQIKKYSQLSVRQVSHWIKNTKPQSQRTAIESKVNFLPHFSKIKQLFSRFSSKQKLYTILALALVFIVPFFIVQFSNKPKTPIAVDTEIIPISQIKILASEKNINFNTELKNIYSDQNIITSLITNNIPTAITKSNIVLLQNGQPKEFPLPTDAGTPIKATYMNDLSLIFIVTDTNKVISFSPVSEKFTQSNNIDLTNISQTSFIGTYLTYLYVLDQKASQIYRFPRAEGGFGEKTEWLKDSTSLSEATEMTIDDNIYAVADNKVLKFFKGKIEPFELEASNTSVVFNKIYTTPELQSIYALDSQNSRVIQYGKDGAIVAQFFNDALKESSSLAVDEKNKVAYIATPSGLVSLLLQ